MSPISQRLRRLLEWIAAPEGSPLEAWRRRILAAMLLGTCIFGLIAYIVGVGAAIKNGVRSVIVVDTIVYGTIVMLTFGRRLPYTLRAGALVVFPGLLGLFFLISFGYQASGFPWLLAFPIFASVLLGLRAGFWSVAIVTVVLVGLGIAIPYDLMPWTATTPNAFVMWWVNTSTVVMLGALVSLTAGYLFDGLGREATARQAAELEADRRERLAALGTLTGGIAHDFNNLLQPILSDAEHVRRLLPRDHEAQTLLEHILVTTSRARTLVRRILSFARPAQGQREVVELGALALESERLLRAVLPASVELRTVVHESAHVMAEPAEVQQVLLNLVTNSVHAMPDGGTVTITVQQLQRDATVTESALQHAEHCAVLTVSDSGIGMNAELLSHIFEPFFTTKRPGQGTGLGLATVHATVAAMGGVMRAESTPGIGTRISALLPVVTGHVLPSPVAPPEPVSTTEGPTPHVVVVDDDPAVLLAASRLIERLGYRVSRFESPEAMVRALDTLTPPPDLLVTDLSMPGMSGWDLAAIVHARRPSLPIVVMTGNLELEDPQVGRPAAVTGILSKPFTTAELRAMLQRCLGDR